MGMQLRAFGVHHLNQRFHDQRIEATQRRVFTHEQVRLRAQAVNYARQLNGDIARADNRNAFRQRRQFEETIGINAVFDAGDIRMARAAAGGDQNMIGGYRLAVNFDGFRIDKTGEAFNHIDLIFAQHVIVGGVDTIDIGATAGDQFVPVEVIDSGIKTVIRTIQMDGFTDLRRMPHDFFRHAADVHAGTAQVFGFNQRALLAVHSGTVNGGDTAAAAANGDIVIMLAHESYP